MSDVDMYGDHSTNALMNPAILAFSPLPYERLALLGSAAGWCRSGHVS